MSSSSTKPISKPALNTHSDHLKKLTNDVNNSSKPDFHILNSGSSPVSPLQPEPTTSTSTSSSSSGSVPGKNVKRVHFHADSKSHSDSSPCSSGGSKPGRTRSISKERTGSHPLVQSNKSSATSPAVHVLPSGNICPSGKILKTGMTSSRSSKSDILSHGTCSYGHGSIVRGGSAVTAVSSNYERELDGEELKRLGREQYKMGNFLEALSYYNGAIDIEPDNPVYRCYRVAALMALCRLNEAVKECEEAIRLDFGYMRAHRRLGSLLISLGQVENARKHICIPGYEPDQNKLKRLQSVEKHLNKCADCRRVQDWAGVIRECDAAMASGAYFCPQLFACKAEAFLKLGRVDDASVSLFNMPKFEASCGFSYSQPKFFGIAFEAYLLFVRAQVDMALGRFENAVTTIEKAGQTDSQNIEIAVLLQKFRAVSEARARGNDLFKSERFTEACSAYDEGLRLDPLNPVLYCNRAACWFKLGQLERSLDDCNRALLIHPNYTKALLRRAATYSKLDQWGESVRDYEVLRRVLPDDNEIAESLFHAQVALKKFHGEEVYNMQFGGEVESITSLDQFKSTVSSTGTSVVLFKSSSNRQCKMISRFLDTLCTRYPSIIFLKVDVEESSVIAKTENVRIVPTIKIYKKGNRMKEMVHPSQEALESSVKHHNS
ncbi:putative tetratricopeptide-like helical domain superfamily, Thioredoxin domain-containing protein [Helianthus annuus]|nr:putative tetratricopeptide-like helical domain superfamily, Thioredoxin domain-containing protein [Helianthus annuus]